MPHTHNVYDTDKRFVINTITKTISTPKVNVPVLVQYDHNSEHITFEADRFVEGHDLSLCDKVEVHYNNVGGTATRTSKGVYQAQDFKIDPLDKSKVVFTWVLSEKATTYTGVLAYIVSFTCTSDGEVLYRWNTNVDKTLMVSDGINNGEAVEEMYADVLEMWKLELFGIGDTEEGSMRRLAETLKTQIEDKGTAVLKTIPGEYLDYSALANSIDVPSAILYTEKGYINPVGEFTSNASYAATDYILYTSGDILLRGIWVGSSSSGIAFYDENKTFISGRTNISGDIFVPGEEVPSGTKYIRSGTLLSSSTSPAVFINTYGTVSETAVYVNNIKSELSDIRKSVNRDLTFIVGGYVYSEGIINPTNNALVTDYAIVKGYSKVKVKATIEESGYLLAYYDRDKVFLPDISIRGSGRTENVYDIPEDAYYLRVSSYGLANECYAILHNTSTETFKSYEHKRILTLGDSITAIESNSSDYARSWKKYFCDVVKPSLLVSTAVPGAAWRDKTGTIYDGNPVINGADDNVNNVIGNQVEKIIRAKTAGVSDYDDFDAIFIAAGTNDWDDASSLTDSIIEESFYNGTTAIIDLLSLDRTTWAGAIRYTVDTLRTLYPNTDIFVCTPVQRVGNDQYSRVLSKSNGIKKIVRRLGVILVDSMECGVYDMTCPSGGQEGDFNDGLHLSPQGAKKLGYYNARCFINHYSFDVE